MHPKPTLICLRPFPLHNTCSSETAGAQADHHTARMYGRVDEAGRYLGPKAGSTAAVAVVQGDRLFVAHAGDSRCESRRYRNASPHLLGALG